MVSLFDKTYLMVQATEFYHERQPEPKIAGLGAVLVSSILVRSGEFDPTILVASVLHDMINQKQTTGDEIEKKFGSEIRVLVEELSEDPTLPEIHNVQSQSNQAAYLSRGARSIKLAIIIEKLSEFGANPTKTREDTIAYFACCKLITDKISSSCGNLRGMLDQMYEKVLGKNPDVKAIVSKYYQSTLV
jgi:hypothetical protein